MKKFIGVVEVSMLGANYIAKAIESLGFRPLFLSQITNQEGDALTQLVSHDYLQCDTTSADDIIAVLNLRGIDSCAGVVTFLDSRLGITSAVCSTLKLPGVSPVVAELKDKAYVNRLIPEFVPASIEVDSRRDEEAIKAFVERYPCIVGKPAYAAGARGMFTASSCQETLAEMRVGETEIPGYLKPNAYVLQEFASGELLSIEGYVLHGDLVFIGATGRRKIGNTETADLFPYQDKMTATALRKCHDAITELVLRSGLANGFFHVEFMVDGDACKLIDANMGRPGGAYIAELVSNAYGLNPIDFFANAISIALGQGETIPHNFWAQRKPELSLGIGYGVAQPSRIVDVFLLDSLQSVHTLGINKGSCVAEIGKSNWSVIGMLAGGVAEVSHDIRNIAILTEDGIQSPAYASFEGEGFLALEEALT